MDSEPTRILLADDHRLVRSALRHLIESFPGMDVVAEAGSSHELLQAAGENPAHVALVDTALASLGGLNLTGRLQELCAGIQTVVLSVYASDSYIRRTLAEGACGFIHMNAEPEDLESAIRLAAAGQPFVFPAVESGHRIDPILVSGSSDGASKPLTARQEEVLRLVATGYRTRAIAEHLGVSVKTVETHRAEIMRRLGLRHMAGMVREAIRLGLVSTYP